MGELNKSFWLKSAMVFFIIGSLMGLLMRFLAVYTIDGVDYGYVRQGHSHVAFLGWGYLAIMVLLIHVFLPEGSLKLRKYRWNFIFTILTVGGMFFSFPLTGYKIVSISLLILFLVASCILVFHFLKDFWKTKPSGTSRLFINAAFFFYLLSGIGPFALGPIVVLIGKTDIYYLAVYYYLHFLYNGFFVFAIFGLLMKYFETYFGKGANPYSTIEKYGRQFFWLTFFACIPAYALSTLWVNPPALVFVIAGISALLQMVALFYFIPLIKLLKNKFSYLVSFMLGTALCAYFLKLLFQLLSGLPWFAVKSFEAKSYVIIGYIHLVALGFISLFLLAWIILGKTFVLDSFWAKAGVFILLTGIFLSETLLFLKGLLQWLNKVGFGNFHELLFVASTLIPLGLLVLWIGQPQNSSR
jgi:hypothetical protein